MKLLRILAIFTLILGVLGVLSQPVSADPRFEAAVQYSCGNGPLSIATAYLDGDGNLDLVTGNQGTSNVSILLGIGDGTFASAVNYAAGTAVADVEIADMNNDGFVDLVVGTDDVKVLYGVGDGTFGTATSIAGTRGAISVVVANLDGDAHLDIGAADYFDDSSCVVLSHDTSTWAAPVPYMIGSALSSITAANLDADANIDLAISTNSSGIWMLTNNGSGSFTPTQIWADLWEWPVEIIADDFNGDNETDLAVANYDNFDVSVFLSNGNGTFQTPPIAYAAGDNPNAIASADIDDDGETDIMMANHWNDDVEFLKGVGDGSFLLDSAYAVGAAPTSIAVGDFDNDGYIDVAVTSEDDNNVSVLMNRTGLLQDVNDDGEEILPGNFYLSQNYPNPFNPATSISYTLTRRSNVELTIYNVIGQAVRTLIKKSEAAGDRTVTWDGCNDKGNSLSTGVYFYSLKTDLSTQTKKMAFLK